MKNQKPSYITLSLSLALSVIYLVILFLGVFGVLVPAWQINSNFNYLIAFCLVAINFILTIVFLAIEKHSLLDIPEWFRVVFFVGFFIFTNLYYYFNLYNLIYTNIVFYLYLALVLSILSISIFYNVQREDKKVVKVNNKFASVSTFTYSTSIFLILEAVITGLKLLFNNTLITNNGIILFLINTCTVVLICAVISILFYVSLSRKKVFVNKCLIKVKMQDETQK